MLAAKENDQQLDKRENQFKISWHARMNHRISILIRLNQDIYPFFYITDIF